MIVEYIDSYSGDGWGLTLFNPTSAPINLSNYSVGVYNNGNTAMSGSLPLTGTLQPNATIKVGNSTFCGNCTNGGGCGVSGSVQGVNWEDAIILYKNAGQAFVDMIGTYSAQVRPNIDGTPDGLYRKHIYRNPNNCIRYTAFDGTSPNSWPGSGSVVFQGWRSVPSNAPGEDCLQGTFSLRTSVSLGLSADTSICPGEVIELVATGGSGTSYSWNTGQTGPRLTVRDSGQYIVTASQAGCLGRDTVNVGLLAQPVIDLGDDVAFCDTALIGIPLDIGYHYRWLPSGDTTGFQFVTTSGEYILIARVGRCTGSDTIQATKKPKPAINLADTVRFCRDNQIPVAVGVPAGTRLLWSTGDTTVFISIRTAGNYGLTATLDGCVSQDSVQAVEVLPPIALFSTPFVACADSLILVQPDLTVPGARYRWSTGDTTAAIRAGAGEYLLFISGPYPLRCQGQATVRVTEEAAVPVSVPNAVFCPGSSVTVQAPAGFDRYIWSTGEVGPQITVRQAGSFSITAFSSLGCPSTGSFNTSVAPCNQIIPNVFTPNKDLSNDTWTLAEPFLREADVHVYNRWGKEVFASSSPMFSWAGDDSASGTYFYRIQGTTIVGEAFQATGWVELVR